MNVRSEHVLLIDDDVELCQLVAQYLTGEGFVVESVHDGTRGVEAALDGRHDILVLDVMLPGANGFEVLRRIRPLSRIPVIMLTARGEEVDKIVGLELGADDYLTKPFSPRELVARIRAVLRRSSASEPPATVAPESIIVADVEINLGSRTVTRGGQSVELTTVEFDLLAILLRAAGHVVSREQLVAEALG
ncbi:MAG: response regulator transcription factor, partial [Blastocatellia bacterium]